LHRGRRNLLDSRHTTLESYRRGYGYRRTNAAQPFGALNHAGGCAAEARLCGRACLDQRKPHPTAEWIAQQITEAFPWSEAPCYLIRDQDGIYGAAVTRWLRAMGIREKPIAPGSPWQNAFAQRLIGSIRRECVDHMVVLGEAHLRRVLNSYPRYYNESRIHRSLSKDAPFPRAIEGLGVITSRPVLGGLHQPILQNMIFGTHKTSSSGWSG
jgi:hypothetical protein